MVSECQERQKLLKVRMRLVIPLAAVALLLAGALASDTLAQGRGIGYPRNLRAEEVPNGVSLVWDAPSSNAASVTGYEILRRRPKHDEDVLQTLVADTGSTETSYTDTTATEPNGRYTYRVKALRSTEKSRQSNYVTIDRGGNNDRAALVALYNSTNGDQWRNNSNWLSSAPLDQWYGVKTDFHGRVAYLELFENDLSGRIPAELADLHYLLYLDASRNDLSGSIPAALGDLDYLIHLDISSNDLFGEVPQELAGIDDLSHLDLSLNNLQGNIPGWLGNFAELSHLDLSNNDFIGQIPAELGNISTLTHLDLTGNHGLNGPLPVELGNLTNLETLSIYWTFLGGEIPSELGNLASLKNLDMGLSSLRGEIPAELGKLSQLVNLNLTNNKLTGEIPRELGNLTNLSVLDLASNELTGEIPDQMDGLVSLEKLALPGNRLTGDIPPGLGNLVKLSYVDISSNKIEGEIPSELGNLSVLTRLDLAWNDLSGAIPTELAGLPNLAFLDLAGNDFGGEIPAELGNGGHLYWINFFSNSLTGTIPPELGGLRSLSYLVLRSNELTGEIPPELGNATELMWLDLSCNDLTGDIPQELGNLKSLLELFLRGNSFTGSVPQPLLNAPPYENDLDQLDGTDCPGERAGGSSNTQASGAPAISGTPRVGETLTALTSDISDDDGMTVPSFEYEWISVDGGTDTGVDGADGDSHTLTSADVGKRFKVRVSFTDDAGNAESLTSEPTASVEADVPGPPLNSQVSPKGSGELHIEWDPPPDERGSAIIGYNVQWKLEADDWETTGETRRETSTGTSYTVTGLTNGAVYALRVLAVNGAGQSEPSAEATGTPEEPPPVWSGTLTVGTKSSYIPELRGYTLWGVDAGVLSESYFNHDEAGYRIVGLYHYAGGLYLNMSLELLADFTLTIGDLEFVAGESSDPETPVNGRYWWAADGLEWNDGDTREVSISLVEDSAGLSERPLAPPTASIDSLPKRHDGESAFSFHLRFSDDVPTSYRSLREHSMEVTNGTVVSAKRITKGSSRSWIIMVQPASGDDVGIALLAGQSCDLVGAICTTDGRRLFNSLEVSVSGPEGSSRDDSPSGSG